MTGVPPPNRTSPQGSPQSQQSGSPNYQQTLDYSIQAIRANSEALSNVRLSLRDFKGSFEGFFNPVTRLRDSIQRLDKTNQVALSQGINQQKFREAISKNSAILQKGLTSNQKLLDAMLKNADVGLKLTEGAFGDLMQEMEATGQSMEGLRQGFADMVLFTGGNTDAVQRLAKTNKEVSDKYGISNQRLIESMNSLKEVFEEASFFGGDTTASLGELAMQLKGRSGGLDTDAAVRTLMKLGTGGMENIAATVLTGGRGFRGKIAAGGRVGVGDIMPILEQIEAIAGSSRGVGGSLGLGADVAAARLGLSKQQVNQLLMLNEQLKLNHELDENVKASEDERYASVENLQKRALNFYDDTAMRMLNHLQGMSAGLAMLGIGLLQARGASKIMSDMNIMPSKAFSVKGAGRDLKKAFGFGRKGTRLANLSRTAGRAGGGVLAGMGMGMGIGAIGDATDYDLGGASLGATVGATIGSVIPGVGTLVGGAAGAGIGLLVDIVKNTGKTAEELEAERRAREEKENRERAERNSRDMSRLEVMSGYIRARGGSFMSDPEMLKISQELLDETKKLRAAMARNQTTSSGRGP